MSTPGNWKEGVKVVRASSLDAQVRDPAGTGRATAFDFAGAGSGLRKIVFAQGGS